MGLGPLLYTSEDTLKEPDRVMVMEAMAQASRRAEREHSQCVVYFRPEGEPDEHGRAMALYYVRLATEPAPQGARELYRTTEDA